MKKLTYFTELQGRLLLRNAVFRSIGIAELIQSWPMTPGPAPESNDDRMYCGSRFHRRYAPATALCRRSQIKIGMDDVVRHPNLRVVSPLNQTPFDQLGYVRMHALDVAAERAPHGANAARTQALQLLDQLPSF